MKYIRRNAQILPDNILDKVHERKSFFNRNLLLFTISYISCLITPINLWIIQYLSFQDSLVILGSICDLIIFLDLIYSWNKSRHLNHPFTSINSPNYYLLSCNLLSLLPLGIYLGLFPIVGDRLIWLLFPRILRIIQLYTSFMEIIASREFTFLSNGTISRVAMIFIFGSLHASFLSCIWFYISCPNRKDCPEHNAWVAYDTVLDQSVTSSYIRSLYFVVQTLFTIGYGDVSPQNDHEIFFSLFLIFNGSLFYGCLISSITSLLCNQDIVNQRYRNDLSLVRKYLDIRNVSPELRYRIDKLFNFLLSRQGGMIETQFLETLPIGLTKDIMRSFIPMLRGSNLFSNQGEKIINLCAERLSFRTYVPNSTIFFQNERKRELIIIRMGRIDIKVQTARNALFSCMAGDVLGEFEFLFGTPSPVTADTSAFSEILVLHYNSFVEVVKLSTGLDVETWLLSQQDSLNSVIESHKKFLSRVIKVRLTIEDLQRKRKMIDMMASISEEPLKYFIAPDSIFCPIWSALVVSGTIYYMIVIPFRILWNLNCGLSRYVCLSQWDWTLMGDYLFDIVFIVDVILNAAVFAYPKYESQREVIVFDRKEIFYRFLNSFRAKISFLALIPIDIFAVLTGWILCYRFTKLIWVTLLFENIQAILNFSEKYREKNLLSTDGVTVLYLSITSIFAALYMALIWCILHERGSIGMFIEGLYFCLTSMTTVGYGDIVPTSTVTTFFTVFLSIIGPTACATIIANAATYLISVDSSVDNIGHRISVIRTLLTVGLSDNDSPRSVRYLGHEKLGSKHLTENSHQPADLHQFLAYVESVGREKDGLDETKLLATMIPDYLADDIKQYMTMDLVLASKFFRSCDTSFIRGIMLSLELHYLVANKTILYPGVPATGMYLIHSGFVQISTAQGRKTQKLSKGDSFGEIFLFEENGYCNFRAESSGNCEVWFLSRLLFVDLIQSHGILSDSPTFLNMLELAKESCRSLIDTPLPSLAALQVIQEIRASNDAWIIRPDSGTYQIWIFLLLFFSTSNIFLIPYGAAFLQEKISFSSSIFWLQYIGDIFHLLDIILRLTSLGFYEEDRLITSKSKIFTKYFYTSFIYHTAASIPFDLFLLFGTLQYESMWQTLMIYRINKLIRWIDVPFYLDHLERHFFMHAGSLFKHTTKLIRLIFIVFIAAHIAGCLFFIVANQKNFHGSDNNWADHVNILRSCTLGYGVKGCNSTPSISLMISQYIHAIYWATGTLTTVGYGDIYPISSRERLFCILVFFMGTSVYAMVVTCLQDIVSNLDVTSDLYKNRYDRIRKLLLREKSSEELKKKTNSYLEKLWTTQRGAHPNEIKQFLSLQLYSELNQNILKKKFDNIFFIKQCHLAFRSDISSKLEINHYLMTDFIFHSGEAALTLYLLVNGEIALVNEDSGHQYGKIFANEGILGETEFFTKSCYSCAAQVTRDVTCYELNYLSFWHLIIKYEQQENFYKLLNLNFITLWKQSTHHLANTLNENLKNSKMTKMLTTIRPIEKYGYYIIPTSIFSSIWSLFTLIWLIYSYLSIPYCIAFTDMSSSILLFDGLQCLFFLIDIYLSIRYFAIEMNGILIKDWRIFSNFYLDSNFKLDCLATVPLALIIFGTTRDISISTILRFLYLFRYHKLKYHAKRLLTLIESVFDYRFSSNFLRMLMMITVVWYFGHIACCCMCFIGKLSSHYSWLDENEIREMSSMKIYLRGYLWAMYTIVTVGYGNIQLVTNVERTFAVCIMLSGAILCDAGVTAVLSSLISQSDKQNAVMRRNKQATISFCRSNLLSDSLTDKVTSYFEYLTNELNDCSEIDDYNILPKPILHELVQEKCFDALCSLCLLDIESSQHRLGFVYNMIRYMIPTMAIPGQILLHAGDDSDIHILRKGKVYTRYYGIDGLDNYSRDYFQEGEALCHEGRLHTTNAMSPGKLVQITLGTFQPISISSTNFSITSGFQQVHAISSSIYHVKMCCGARKSRSSNKSCSSTGVTWKESFTFHVPRAVSSIQLTIYDEKHRETVGYVGQTLISFKDLDSIEEHPSSKISIVPKSAEINSAHKYQSNPSQSTTTSNHGGNISDTTSTNDNDSPSLIQSSHRIKKDVRDKNGQLKGFIDLQITLKNAGILDETVNKRKSDFLKHRKFSTKPADIVCETFCHLFTLEGYRLSELKSFFRNHLRIGKQTDDHQRKKKKKFSFCQASILQHVIHERSPQINEIPIVDDNNNQMPATAVSRPIPSSETSSIRRHVRESSLAIPTIGSILKSNRESMNEKSNRITIHEERKISTEEDATPISIPDISEQELEEALGLSSMIHDINRGLPTRPQFRLSWV